MLPIQLLKTIPLYFDYFLKVTDKHGLQAPFIFQFYSSLIEGLKENSGNPTIESWRESLLKNKNIVKGIDFGAGSRVKSKTIASIARYGISSKKDCLLLHELIRIIQPKTCIELGTSLGIGTAYLAKASADCNIYTFEGNGDLIRMSQALFAKLSINNIHNIQGSINDTLPEKLEELDIIDMVIIDANHTQGSLISYFNLLKPKMNDTGIMVIDDIRWSAGMYRGWKKIALDQQVTISLEFLNKGFLFFRKTRQKQHYILSY